MKRPRVLLADDHRLLCDAFSKILEPHCQVVGTATDGRMVLHAATELEPDIILLDIGMPLLNGLDVARQLQSAHSKIKLIFLTMNDDPDLAAEAFRIGASGYLIKNSAVSELLQAIREVSQGRSYFSPLTTQGLAGSYLYPPQTTQKPVKLSDRQREVLQLLAEGHAMKSIARILKITPRTVAFHKYTIMELLKIKSNAELVQYAIKHHIVTI